MSAALSPKIVRAVRALQKAWLAWRLRRVPRAGEPDYRKWDKVVSANGRLVRLLLSEAPPRARRVRK